MYFTALTSIAAAVTGTVAVVATGAILAFSPPSDGPDVWFDFPGGRRHYLFRAGGRERTHECA